MFRRSLLLKSSLGLFAVSILLVLACLLPLTQRLKSEQEKLLFFAVTSRTSTVEIFLAKAIETTKQITSRSKIREMLEQYNREEITLAELENFTRPKLDDAINLSGNGIGVRRFDAHNNLTVSAGFPIPARHWVFPTAGEDFVIKGPEIIDNKLYLLVSAPILTKDHQRVGTDIVLFTTDKIQEITQDTSGFGKTGEMILGRLAQNGAQSFYPLRNIHHPKKVDELFLKKEIDQAFTAVAEAETNSLPLIIREGHALKVGDRIKHTDWIILCNIDKDELYAPINTLIAYLILFVAALLILGLYGMKRLLVPLADKAIVHSEKLHQELLEKQEALKQREQAEKALGEEKEQLAVTLRSIADCVITTDPMENIELFNCAAQELLGYTPDEAKGRPLSVIVPLFSATTQTAIAPPYTHALNDISPFPAETKVLLHTKDGTEKKAIVKHSPMLGAEYAERGNVWVIRDITEQEKLENRIRQTQKMEAIGTLAAGIAHDFNNILTALLGYGELIRNALDKKSKEYHWQEEVITATNRAHDLVKQILTFSRQTEQEKMPLDLSHVVKEAVKLLRASIPATIEIHQEIQSNCGMVLADPTQIHQVVMNLCTNAFHAMGDAPGVLSISLMPVRQADKKYLPAGFKMKPGEYVLLEVSDTGQGIAPAIIEHIFDPYFTTKKKGHGTGLGLAVVQGIVKSYEGAINVLSEKGKGTTFQIFLPKIADQETLQATYPSPAEKKAFPQGSEHLLLVDDEKPIADLMAELLQSFGYRVTAFTDPHQALAAFVNAPQHFALLITDISMPKLTGLELAKKCKEVRADLPVLLCSGTMDLTTDMHDAGIEINGYLTKPLLTEKLLLTVRRALDSVPPPVVVPPHPAAN
ncbi:MAG: ATP-binding protein [Desulfobulbaceae bacterium]|nr:ATP-binding protein [Desulfobulbaceae bacterium]